MAGPALASTSVHRSAQAVDSLAADLRAARRQYADSYQLFLWRSYHLAHEALEGKDWIQIEPSLIAQGFHIDEWSRRDSTGHYGLTLSGLAYQPAGGPLHEFAIRFDFTSIVSRTAPTRAPICRVTTRLRTHFQQPLADIAKKSPYPKGSILDAFLQLPELKQVRDYSLDMLELEYSPPLYSLGAVVPSGYYAPYSYVISADYLRRDGDTQRFKDGLYFAASGLDPEELQGAPQKHLPGFIQQDTFGPIQGDILGESTGQSERGGVIDRCAPADVTPRASSYMPTAYSIADLRALPVGITALRLRGSSLTNTDLHELGRFQSLTTLDMSGCEGAPQDLICETGLQVLRKLPHLTNLTLGDQVVTDGLCKTLSSLKELTSLSLQEGNLSDAGVRSLATLPHLVTLRVPYSGQLTDASLGTMGTMPDLRHLTLGGGEFSDSGLKTLRALKRLTTLELETSQQ